MVKSHFTYVLVFGRRSIAKMFSAPPAVLLFGWAFVCFVFVWLFILLPFGFTEFKNRQSTRAKVKSAMTVRACVIILCSFVCHSLQNNNMELTLSSYNTTTNV